MATKSATLRVHQLAKELGVSSKMIVEKCKAEDIPNITNHMSAVSIGLAATVREWFGGEEEPDGRTAVESAAPIDVARARAEATKKKAARRKAAPKKAAATSSDATEADAPTPTETPAAPEAPAKAEPAAPAKAEPTAPAPEEPAPTATPAPETTPAPDAAPAPESAPPPAPAADVPGGEAPTRAAAETTGDDAAGDAADGGKAVPNVPTKPKVVAPVGRQLARPEATKLAGPKIVRIEQPDQLPAPRSRSGPGGPGRGPGRGPGGPRTGGGVGMPEPGMPPDAGRGGGGGGGGRGGGGRGGRNVRRSADRNAQPRAGRLGPQESRPFNWREARAREERITRQQGGLRQWRRDSIRGKGGSGGGKRAKSAAETGGSVRVEEPIVIKELSSATGVRVNDIVARLVAKGLPIAMPDSVIESDVATEIMLDFNIELEVVEQKSAEEQIAESFQAREMHDERPRSPVVTILGHVDHGKTSLLDSIRNTNVAAGEAGGITQATSAFRVPVTIAGVEGEKSGRELTFIDTPGHEAFTEMRSRGAQVTDIVILVVAADDGVMPQTIESINHAKAAGVPIVVALNKIDKPEATDDNIQRILGQLAENDLQTVDWGGDVELVRISALKGEGIDQLLEVVDYQAQLLELTGDFAGPAEGVVLEAQVEEGRGAVANVLVQQGELKKGDYVFAGRAFGRVRDIVDDHGKRRKEATVGMPVAISGLNEVPAAGEKLYAVKNLREAEQAAEERREDEREKSLASEGVTLDNIFAKLEEQGRAELPLIVKADVHGSLETLRAVVPKITGESKEVAVAIKHSGVGGVNESDVQLAETTGAIILAFNVTANGKTRRLAEERGVEIRYYDVIYDLTDDVKKAAEGLLEPELKLEVLGHAEVRAVFKVSKVGMVAGCYVTDGTIQRHAQIRVTRDGVVVEKDRRLEQLKRFKDDAKEVNAGQECGMKIEAYNDIHEGDVLECYRTQEVARTL